jgi:hypothetical protein
MRTTHEIKRRLGNENLTTKEKQQLQWVLGNCNTCDGHGKIGGCPDCGKKEMCLCDGTIHEAGAGCNRD